MSGRAFLVPLVLTVFQVGSNESAQMPLSPQLQRTFRDRVSVAAVARGAVSNIGLSADGAAAFWWESGPDGHVIRRLDLVDGGMTTQTALSSRMNVESVISAPKNPSYLVLIEHQSSKASHHISVLALATNEVTQLDTGWCDGRVAFSPDGRHLATGVGDKPDADEAGAIAVFSFPRGAREDTWRPSLETSAPTKSTGTQGQLRGGERLSFTWNDAKTLLVSDTHDRLNRTIVTFEEGLKRTEAQIPLKALPFVEREGYDSAHNQFVFLSPTYGRTVIAAGDVSPAGPCADREGYDLGGRIIVASKCADSSKNGVWNIDITTLTWR